MATKKNSFSGFRTTYIGSIYSSYPSLAGLPTVKEVFVPSTVTMSLDQFRLGQSRAF